MVAPHQRDRGSQCDPNEFGRRVIVCSGSLSAPVHWLAGAEDREFRVQPRALVTARYHQRHSSTVVPLPRAIAKFRPGSAVSDHVMQPRRGMQHRNSGSDQRTGLIARTRRTGMGIFHSRFHKCSLSNEKPPTAPIRPAALKGPVLSPLVQVGNLGPPRGRQTFHSRHARQFDSAKV